MRITIPKKAGSLCDKCFMENPNGVQEVVIWPTTKNHGGRRGLRLSVARVEQGKSHATIYFGRILERNGVKITLPVE